MENADKQIDRVKSEGKTQAAVAMAVDGRNSGNNDRRVRTENALKKPQHAWVRDIDNSYNVFVPSFDKKEHFITTESLGPEITAMQKQRSERPDDFRCLVQFGEHKK